MKEIGGYFELEVNNLDMLHKEAYAFNTGSNCLAFLINARHIKKIRIPIYACSSIKATCKKYGLAIKEYRIDNKLRPANYLEEDMKLEPEEWLYVINYYGQLEEDYLYKLKKKYDRIIIDNVQAYFQKRIENCDCIYSARKFFGVADGAFLYTDADLKEEYEKLEYEEVRENMSHLLGRFENSAKNFFEDFRHNEERLAKADIKKMSLISKNLLKGIDYENVGRKRQDNARFLQEKLGKINELDIVVGFGAFSYPLMIKDAEKLRDRLIFKNIYLPLLWPNVLVEASEDSFEYKMADSVLNLVCDQRYDLEDMKYMCELLMGEMGDL